MAGNRAPLPYRTVQWVYQSGRPTDQYARFIEALASGNLGSLPSAANDIAAAAAGVSVGQLYQNAGAVRIRLT